MNALMAFCHSVRFLSIPNISFFQTCKLWRDSFRDDNKAKKSFVRLNEKEINFSQAHLVFFQNASRQRILGCFPTNEIILVKFRGMKIFVLFYYELLLHKIAVSSGYYSLLQKTVHGLFSRFVSFFENYKIIMKNPKKQPAPKNNPRTNFGLFYSGFRYRVFFGVSDTRYLRSILKTIPDTDIWYLEIRYRIPDTCLLLRYRYLIPKFWHEI